jgi:predicted acyl esterase
MDNKPDSARAGSCASVPALSRDRASRNRSSWRVAKVVFRLDDVFHTFKRNHRIMVQVQSSWFPFIDRNPQTFVNIYTAKPSDFVKQTHRVHRTAATPSAIKVRLLPPPDAK